ncbi:MAG: hypothetical protein MHMPM18_001621, partial [Marteilia pararefringens]
YSKPSITCKSIEFLSFRRLRYFSAIVSASHKKFNRSFGQKNSHISLNDLHYNGMLFCLNYDGNAGQEPLQVLDEKYRQTMYNEIIGFEESINVKLNNEIDYFARIYGILCKNLVKIAKSNHREPFIINDVGEIYGFRIFVA